MVLFQAPNNKCSKLSILNFYTENIIIILDRDKRPVAIIKFSLYYKLLLHLWSSMYTFESAYLNEEGENVEAEMSVRIVQVLNDTLRPLETLFAKVSPRV